MKDPDGKFKITFGKRKNTPENGDKEPGLFSIKFPGQAKEESKA